MSDSYAHSNFIAFEGFDPNLLNAPSRIAEIATESIKLVAGAFRKRTDLPHSKLIEMVSQACGYKNWHQFNDDCRFFREAQQQCDSGRAVLPSTEILRRMCRVTPLATLGGPNPLSKSVVAREFIGQFAAISGLAVEYVREVLEQLPKRGAAPKEDDACIYVVEIPHQRPPSAWWASGEKDFIRRVTESHLQSRSGSVLFEVATPLSVALSAANNEGTFYVDRRTNQIIMGDEVTCWIVGHQDGQSASADTVTADDIRDHATPGATAAILCEGTYCFLDPASIQGICKVLLPDIHAFAERVGWDTPIYRCDYVSEEYRSAPITEFEACSAYLESDLHSCYIFRGAPAAIAGLDEISGHGSAGAIDKLRKLLQQMGDLELAEENEAD